MTPLYNHYSYPKWIRTLNVSKQMVHLFFDTDEIWNYPLHGYGYQV